MCVHETTYVSVKEFLLAVLYCLQTGQRQRFDDLVKHMSDLMEWRRQVLTQSLTRVRMYVRTYKQYRTHRHKHRPALHIVCVYHAFAVSCGITTTGQNEGFEGKYNDQD